MFLKSKRMEAIRLESAGVRPASLKHWWKATETSGTTLVDAVAGANLTLAAAVSGSAGIITFGGSEADAPSSVPLTAPLTNKFIWMFQGTVAGLGFVRYGDSNGHSIMIAASPIPSSVKGVTSTVSSDSIPAATNGSYALAYDGTNIQVYANGVIIGSADAYGGGSITTLDDTCTFANTSAFAGAALYVFDGDLPADWAIATAFMGAAWASNDKIVYPSNLDEWGTWE